LLRWGMLPGPGLVPTLEVSLLPDPNVRQFKKGKLNQTNKSLPRSARSDSPLKWLEDEGLVGKAGGSRTRNLFALLTVFEARGSSDCICFCRSEWY